MSCLFLSTPVRVVEWDAAPGARCGENGNLNSHRFALWSGMPHRGRGVAGFGTGILHRFRPINFRPWFCSIKAVEHENSYYKLGKLGSAIMGFYPTMGSKFLVVNSQWTSSKQLFRESFWEKLFGKCSCEKSLSEKSVRFSRRFYIKIHCASTCQSLIRTQV